EVRHGARLRDRLAQRGGRVDTGGAEGGGEGSGEGGCVGVTDAREGVERGEGAALGLRTLRGRRGGVALLRRDEGGEGLRRLDGGNRGGRDGVGAAEGALHGDLPVAEVLVVEKLAGLGGGEG